MDHCFSTGGSGKVDEGHPVVIGSTLNVDSSLPDQLVSLEWPVVNVVLPAVEFSCDFDDIGVLSLERSSHFKPAIECSILLV